MILEDALNAMRAHADPQRAVESAAYHKQTREVLGVSNPVLNDLTKTWRQALSVEERVTLADALWNSNIFEARIAAAKLLTQARIRPDQAVWDLIQSWVPQFDSWAIADHACMAGQKRLVADPSRLNEVEEWVRAAPWPDTLWTRRAALVITLPWTKQNHPKPEEEAARERILGWVAECATLKHGAMQKAVAWWLRDLSKHDAARVRTFLMDHGPIMKPFAVKEAGRHIGFTVADLPEPAPEPAITPDLSDESPAQE
ncbi:DNA alkylation repair protein [Aliiroseovarius crassostreae]|uniref:DNA alkylation repair protein n=1 Tax=Aliiroseovarius crassostreae TaxID=154981 RepID=UPI0022087637|nr:DNA alkylation repair protein [Aliiroseovarius crassostreae]UWP91129.1 DNA alkylation repair protein [Aliiroseovarius crassostreae]